MRQTPLSHLLGVLLGEDLEPWVIARRKNERDWRSIARELERLTGRSVSHESLRSWFATELDRPLDGAA